MQNSDVRKVVVFDLDGTLVRTNTFHSFVIYSIKNFSRGISLWSRCIIILACLLRLAKLISHARLKEIVLSTVSTKMSECDINYFLTQYVLPNLSKTIVAEVNLWKRNNAQLILATAAPELYAKEFASQLGFSYLVATKYVVDDYFEECVGQIKFERIKKILSGKKIDFFYSDHEDDLPSLLAAKNSLLVNPKRETLLMLKELVDNGKIRLLID